MNLIQYISFSIDRAIEMLMDNKTSKIDVALFLMDFKKILNDPEKKTVDGDFVEVEIKGIEEKGNYLCGRKGRYGEIKAMQDMQGE